MQIIANVLLFFPFGMVGAKVIGLGIVPLAIGFSTVLELIQLITRCGLLEFDDNIHNCVGTAIGYIFYLLIRRMWGKLHEI